MNTAHRVRASWASLLAGTAPSMLCVLAVLGAGQAHAATPLADQPVFSSNAVPGNVALALSVEYPTAVSVAHTGTTYSSANTYLGYFAPAKCYLYQAYAPETALLKSHFYSAAVAVNRTCTGTSDQMWSGNFLNWATMQTIDPFRWAMTGGYRVVDTATLTVLEKAYGSGQGGTGNFPNRLVTDSTMLAGATPFTGTTYQSRIQGLGARMTISGIGATGALLGNYYNNTTLTGNPVMTRFDSVNFTWGTAGPGGSVNTTNYSARWTSNATAPAAGTWSFQTTSSDGVRLYVNGTLVINNWTSHASTVDTGSIAVTAGGSLDVTLEYYKSVGSSTIKLFAKAPGASTYTAYAPPADAQNTAGDPQLFVRVRVCDATVPGGVESNCTAYPAGNYKPTGLMQQYARKIRFSAFGYLNDSNIQRDGGVLRARQKFVGPTVPVPGLSDITNAATEWDAQTGIQFINPDATDADSTALAFGVPVTNSGVINYLNKFGEITPGSYKTYDPVSELYYAAIRYYKNLGNVPEWSAMTGANTAQKTVYVDGFPVITTWDDPIQYSCQRNFVLGIGDVNTHADKNVPGSTPTGNEPSKPARVTADTTMAPQDAVTATNKVGVLHGLGTSLGNSNPYNPPGYPSPCCNNNSGLMAGLAYDANTQDIRLDDATKPQTIGKQTVQTYWVDVLENSVYKPNNQYYLAAKYGGFAVPTVYDAYGRSTDILTAWWSTSGQTVGSGASAQMRPDNYFTAGQPDLMVSGLTKAFASIADKLTAYTSAFSTSLPQVSAAGAASYSTQYDAGTWTGELRGSTTTFDVATGAPTLSTAWTFSDKLATQAAGTGWLNSRRIVSFNPGTGLGVPFLIANLSTTQQAALNTIYGGGADKATLLNYLRGDTSQEVASTATGSAHIYRTRTKLLGDIVDSKARVMGPPTAPFSSAANPGYAAFKTTYAARKSLVFVGSNAGMLHAVDATVATGVTGTNPGQEVFAYVPNMLFQGPTATPAVNGLQSVGDPDFTHHFMVDGPQAVFDIDFNNARTLSRACTRSLDWHTVLVGAMGKGGKGYYAIDVTDPSAMTTEAAVAGKVLWEFTDPALGYTYGEPAAVKTRRWGWVLIFGSGYNNTDGKGYFFVVNPCTGELLDKISTGAGTTSNDAGLAQVQAFVLDRSDNTADAVYAGDLLGNLWRLDVTAASTAYPTPVQLAALTDAAGTPLPVTARPLVVVQPGTNRRYVTVGTGRLLASSDAASAQLQAFYAVIDGTALAFGTAATLPLGVSYPVGIANLKRLTDLTQPIALNLATQVGWWFDLGTSAGSLGWRVITDSTSFYGTVAFTATVPSSGDACNASGISRLYAIDLGTGQSQLIVGGATVAFATPLSGVFTDGGFYSVDGTLRFIVGNDKGEVGNASLKPVAGLGTRRLNWRELQLAD